MITEMEGAIDELVVQWRMTDENTRQQLRAGAPWAWDIILSRCRWCVRDLCLKRMPADDVGRRRLAEAIEQLMESRVRGEAYKDGVPKLVAALALAESWRREVWEIKEREPTRASLLEHCAERLEAIIAPGANVSELWRR